MATDRRRRLLVATVVAVVMAGAAIAGAAPVAAHDGAHGSAEADDYAYRLDAFEPGIDGITLTYLSAAAELELVNRSPVEVVVLGYSGEPYLRVGPDGTWRNRRSPATHLNDDPSGTAAVPDEADPEAAPEWEQLSSSTTARWHDHRAHWMTAPPGITRAEPGRSHEIAEWRVPVVVDGERVEAVGTTLWVPGPDPAPWWVAAAVLAAAVVLGAWTRRWWAVTTTAVGLLVAATVVHLVGDWATSAAELADGLAHLGVALVGVAFLVAGLVLAPRDPGAGGALLAGGALALWVIVGWTSRAFLERSQLPTDLSPTLARVAVVAALGLGLGVALVPVVRWARARLRGDAHVAAR